MYLLMHGLTRRRGANEFKWSLTGHVWLYLGLIALVQLRVPRIHFVYSMCEINQILTGVVIYPTRLSSRRWSVVNIPLFVYA